MGGTLSSRQQYLIKPRKCGSGGSKKTVRDPPLFYTPDGGFLGWVGAHSGVRPTTVWPLLDGTFSSLFSCIGIKLSQSVAPAPEQIIHITTRAENETCTR